MAEVGGDLGATRARAHSLVQSNAANFSSWKLWISSTSRPPSSGVN
jgi:hypothetical protein